MVGEETTKPARKVPLTEELQVNFFHFTPAGLEKGSISLNFSHFTPKNA
jgi:hypothetical protein